MSEVQAVPTGHPTVIPHLVVRGAAAAMDFYVKAFGATEVCRMEGPGGGIMHGEIKIGDSLVFLADEAPSWGSLSPLSLNGTPITIHLCVENADATFGQAVAAGATPVMPPSDMFWGDRYGVVVDPYGHKWAMSHRIEDLTFEQMAERGREFMAKMGEGNGGCPDAAKASEVAEPALA